MTIFVSAMAVATGIFATWAVTHGLKGDRRPHPEAWQRAWQCVGGGLILVAGAQVLQAVGAGGPPTRLGLPMVASTVGGFLAVAGLVRLIHQRLPERAADSLSEGLLITLALGFAILSLVLVPAQQWRPGMQVAALLAPLLDVLLLWLMVSLVSLTERHPVNCRYLFLGFACLFVANASAAGLALVGHRNSSIFLEVVALAGTGSWASAFVHPSLRTKFDPVPLRSMRPRGVRMAMLVTVAMVVPVIMTVESVSGTSDRPAVLMIGSTVLPLLLVLYLLHQVFTHAAAEYRAQHDPLTGVCNRLLFEDRLHLELSQAERNESAVSVMFLDLDRFKEINDSLGHAVGNDLLKAVVKRLQGCLRENDTLARFGGDEFTFLFPDSGAKSEPLVHEVAQRILERFDDPFSVGGRQLTVKASIGVAVSPWDGVDAETLLKHADTAMYQAKAAGRNTYQVFDSAMSAKARLRFALEDQLRSAIESGRLTVHYQPKLSMATGDIVGVEALARWRHARLGFIPPWAFIPLAEETSLVATLGEWVLEVACRQAQQWREDGLPAIPVAVNLSPRQFSHQPVVEMVQRVLERTGLDPTLLELEVTESVLMDRVEEVVASLRQLRAFGVRCSIYDCGTGYSALTYLAEMPIDAIKIDKSFVQRIEEEAHGASIVGAVIALAHSLDLTVIAEGVETDAQLEFLDAHGCDQVQGFRFSPPIPAPEFEELMQTPVRLFTEWGRPTTPTPLPISGISATRLESLLESIMLERRWPSDLDDEAIEAVIAALQSDEAAIVENPHIARSRPAAVGPLPELASITGGVTRAVARPVEAVAAEMFGHLTPADPEFDESISGDPAPVAESTA
jgi:diguanylate cyclase (GGDEF)-like protein